MMPNSWKAIQPIFNAGTRTLTTSDLHRQLKKPILVTQSSSLQKKINYYAIEVILQQSCRLFYLYQYHLFGKALSYIVVGS